MKKNLLTSLKELLKALGGKKSDKTNIIGVVDEITEQVKNGGNNDKNGGTLYVKIKTEPYTDPETGEESERNVVYTDPETGNEYGILDKTYTEIMEAKNNGKTIIIEFGESYICYPIRYSESYIWAISTERGCPGTPIEFIFCRTDSDLLYFDKDKIIPQEICAFDINLSFVANCCVNDDNKVEIRVYSPSLVYKGYTSGILFEAWIETDTETGGDIRRILECIEDESYPYIREEDRGLVATLSILLYNKLIYKIENPKINLPSYWGNSYNRSSVNVSLLEYLLNHSEDIDEFTFYI